MAQLKPSMTEAVIVGPMSNDSGSTFFMPDDNSTYDSDATERFTDKLPHEDLGRMMWACEKIVVNGHYIEDVFLYMTSLLVCLVYHLFFLYHLI